MIHRIAFAIILIIMVIALGPLLNHLKGKELCPNGYDYINGVCCLDENKDGVCDEAAPKIEEPKEVEIKEQGPRTLTVEIADLKFYPAELTVSIGDTVVWINKEEKTPHLVFERFNAFRSPRLKPGDKFNFTFEQAGEYIYRDAVFVKQMKGVINVKEKPIVLTGSVVQFSKANIRAISSILLILILILINIVIYKKGKKVGKR